jgi:hypothetical protein
MVEIADDAQQILGRLGRHRLSRGRRERPREHAQPLKEELHGGGQPVIRPADRRLEAAMPSEPTLPAASNHVQSTVQMGKDLGRRQARGPGGGQLDRQREPVQPPAELRDVRCRSRIEQPRCTRRARPREEQLHGGRGLDLSRVVGRWQGQGVQLQDMLAGHLQWHATCGQDCHPGAVFEKELGHLGHRVQHVLAVVKDQQSLGLGQADQRDAQRREPQRLADRARNVRGVSHPRKLTYGHLRQLDVVGRCQGQACLAHTSGPNNGHKRARAQQVP